MARKRPVRRRRIQAKSVGLAPAEMRASDASLDALSREVERDGGAVLAAYREPLGGHPLLLAALPIDAVAPTPYQRDPSDAHVKRLMGVFEAIGRFLDPIVVVRQAGAFWTPNGNHRLQALRKLGVRSITALVVPEREIAFKILALNTEKAHNLREKSLEAIRMARALAGEGQGTERDYAFEFEQPAFLTLGVAYEERPRLSGGAYHPILRRVDGFLDEPLEEAVAERQRRGRAVLKLDDGVGRIVEKLKRRGLTSPYLKPFVVARVNPIRFSRAEEFDFDDVVERTLAAIARFNVDRIRQEDVARAGGAPDPDEG